MAFEMGINATYFFSKKNGWIVFEDFTVNSLFYCNRIGIFKSVKGLKPSFS